MEFNTSPELIEEVAKRATFAGVIICADQEIKTENCSLDHNWDITYSKLTTQQVYELLQDAVEHFKQLVEAETE